MTHPPGDDYSGLPPERGDAGRRPPSGLARSMLAFLVPVTGVVFVLGGALLAAVVAEESESSAVNAFIGALSTGLLTAGGIALGLGVTYLVWVITHPPRG